MTGTPSTDRAPAPSDASGGTMRAIVQTDYGEADVFRLERIPRPAIGEREVLVQVRAAGLDRGTWHLMTGLPYPLRLAFGLRRPRRPVPGLDLAGVVVGVGPDVTRLRPGDEVFGIGKGSFAELAAAREDKLALKPAVLTFEQAAPVAVSGLTALQGLCDVGRVSAGQAVLITGASGGVGTFAVQIATAMGAHVTGVCSAGKADLVRSLGAEHVIDYRSEDFADGRRRYDLILDIAGSASLTRLRRALAPRGTLVVTGGEDGGRWLGGVDRQLRARLLSPFVRQRLTAFVAREHHSGMERLAAMIDDGRLRPAIDRVYPLDRAPDAMRHLQDGRARGKLVISVASDVEEARGGAATASKG